MKISSRWVAASVALCLSSVVAVLCGFGARACKPWPVRVLVTAAPVYDSLAPFDGRERFPQGAQILSLSGKESRLLLSGWAAAADANLSYDATKILYSGKRTASDHWQIYESTLDGAQLRVLSKDSVDCIRPYYLPDRRAVYACKQDGLYQIFVVSLDDPSKSTIISHVPTNMIPDGVLRDGRILFEAEAPLGMRGYVHPYTVYPDGSGIESYRDDASGNHRSGVELPSGDLLMAGDKGAALFTDTSATAVPISTNDEALRRDDRGGFAVVDAQNLIVSWRPWSAKGTTFYSLAWIEKEDGQPMTCMQRMHCIEPVVVHPRPYEKSYPSALHPWSYAHLLSLNSNLSQQGDLPAGSVAKVRVRTLDAQNHVMPLGEAPVENDGSFYLRVPGNRPLQMDLLDREGKIVRREKGWMWIAAGEQRICVGCHVGPQRAPDNVVPGVLWRTTDPVDLTKTTGKK